MSPSVLVIGCGVAGPVLALLLKRKGYAPTVFEKVKHLRDAGASLMLMPNGYAQNPAFLVATRFTL
jgi:salicylate hydroxylase